MPIILSPEADHVSATVRYEAPDGQIVEFGVTATGSKFLKACKDAAALNDLEEDERESALQAAANAETDEWRQKTTPDGRIADDCIVGWSGVQDENGDPLEFNSENLRRLLGLVGAISAITVSVTDAIVECERKNLKGSAVKRADPVDPETSLQPTTP